MVEWMVDELVMLIANEDHLISTTKDQVIYGLTQINDNFIIKGTF